jgi:hypothetical protein
MDGERFGMDNIASIRATRTSSGIGTTTVIWTAADAYGGYGVRPVLYLDSTTYVIEGTGTNADPYIIGM